MIKLVSASWMSSTQEEQNVLRNRFGFDGVFAVKALRLYFDFCLSSGIEPIALSSRSSGDYGDSNYYSVGIEFGREGEPKDYVGLPLMEMHFTEGLASLLTYYEDGLLEILLDVYKTTDLTAAVIIPRFIEAAAAGVKLEELLGLAQNQARVSMTPGRAI